MNCNRVKVLVLALFLMVPLAACAGDDTTGAVYDIYFPSRAQSFGQPALSAEQQTLRVGEEAIPELLRLLLQGPQNERLQAVIPATVTVRDWRLREGTVTVDFSSAYGSLSGIDLTLADYSVTMTLTQLPEVEAVVTTVEGDPIPYRDREILKPGDVFLSAGQKTAP